MRNRFRYKYIIAFLALLLLTHLSVAENLPKYVFLFIGDGMAEPDVLAAEFFVKDQQALSGVAREQIKGLNMTGLPIKGSARTFSLRHDITDSAASATALSSGHKTINGALNLIPNTECRFETMAKFVQKRGMKVGVISSAAPNHATPAGFYAHAEKRNMYPSIAMQLAAADLNYVGGPKMMGGGKVDHRAKREAQKNGYTIVESRQAFDALEPGAENVWVRTRMPSLIDDKHEISLADHVKKAIQLLKDSDGFFMMVEGAQIDWASHANDAAGMIHELLGFDEAVGEAVAFCRQAPDDTLIVVTSDHECGGLSLDQTKIKARGMSKVIMGQKGSRGASAGVFKKIEKEKRTFDEALPAMRAFFGIEKLTDEEREKVRKVFQKGGASKGDFTYSDSRNITLVWSRLVSERAGLIWSSLSHTGDAVPVYATGAGARYFEGNSDNALIGFYIKELISKKFDKK